MAKTKAVLALLATAQAIFEVNQDERLKASIEELEALEDATHSTTKYKNLKDIVDELAEKYAEENARDENSLSLYSSRPHLCSSPLQQSPTIHHGGYQSDVQPEQQQ